MVDISWFDTIYYQLLYRHRSHKEAQVFVEKIIQYYTFDKTHSLIDVACGRGRHAFQFAPYFKKVVGIDVSEESILAAKQINTYNNVEFAVHDCLQPYDTEKFNIVFNAFTSFGYYPNENDNDKFFSNMCNMLTDKGILIFDYINYLPFETFDTDKSKLQIEGIDYEIIKSQDKQYFIKDIIVTDTNKNFVSQFQERVKKYTFEDIANKITNNALSIINTFGDYNLNKYDSTNTARMIVIAKK